MSKLMVRKLARVALGSFAMLAVAMAPVGCASTKGCGGKKPCAKGCAKPCCKDGAAKASAKGKAKPCCSKKKKTT